MAATDVLTLAEAKIAVNLTETTAEDAKLARWVTAVSERLDDLVGPVVRRTVTDQLEGGDCSVFLSTYPVTSVTSVKEYDRYGTETVLTAETLTVKPGDGYRTKPYSADPTLLGNELERRVNGGTWLFAQDVLVEYTAGRVANTATVGEKFKQAAALMLKNVWPSTEDATRQVDEYDVPALSYPKFMVSKAVRDMFPGELQDHHL